MVNSKKSMVNRQSLSAEIKAFRLSPYASRFTPCGGFTLVELLVSILLTSIIMGAIYSVYRVQTRTVKAQESRLEAQEYARAVLDMMVREIRNAGYFPVGACVTLPANVNGVVAASAQSFQFVYDANAANGCADPDENITYAFNTAGCTGGLGNITRKEGANAAQSMTDCNVTNLQLIYYPQQTGATAPPPYCYVTAGDLSGCSGIVTANLANIQRVSISLTVRSKSPDIEFGGGQLNATMTSNADLRNRGLPS